MTLLHDSQHDHFPEQSTPLGRFYLPSSTPRCGCEMACWWIWGCLRQVRPASADRTVHPSILVATLYIVVKCTHHHPSKLVPHPQLKERRCCLSPIYSTLYVVRFCKYIYIYITINPSLIWADSTNLGNFGWLNLLRGFIIFDAKHQIEVGWPASSLATHLETCLAWLHSPSHRADRARGAESGQEGEP